MLYDSVYLDSTVVRGEGSGSGPESNVDKALGQERGHRTPNQRCGSPGDMEAVLFEGSSSSLRPTVKYYRGAPRPCEVAGEVYSNS